MTLLFKLEYKMFVQLIVQPMYDEICSNYEAKVVFFYLIHVVYDILPSKSRSIIFTRCIVKIRYSRVVVRFFFRLNKQPKIKENIQILQLKYFGFFIFFFTNNK